MPEKPESRAFQELVRVLEEALEAGVDSINMEFEDGGLFVYFRAGAVGIGARRFPRDIQDDVIAELVKRAGLSRKSSGKMQPKLLGKDYEISVNESDSFGESCFDLTLKGQMKETRPRKKKKSGD